MTEESTLLNQEIELDERQVEEFDFLTPDHLKAIKAELNYLIACDQFEDGVKSIIGDSGHQIFLKRSKQSWLKAPDQTFWGKLAVQPWVEFVCQAGSGRPMFSRIEEGGYYRCHFDHPQNGMFSTTLFLSNPEDYEGGELELLVNGELKQYKLEAGRCVTYETGLPHQVKTVTKGVRNVLVWWTNTCIPHKTDLYAWRTLKKLTRQTGHYPIDKEDIDDDLYNFVKKPHAIYAQAANNIIRKHLYAWTQEKSNTGI